MLDQYAINTKNANGICRTDRKHFWAVYGNLGKGILVFQQRYTNGTRPMPTSDSRILYNVNSSIKYGIPKRKDTHARKKNANKRAVTKPGLKKKNTQKADQREIGRKIRHSTAGIEKKNNSARHDVTN